ncbi:Kae1-associated serine/threonine protein kinase [Candidatus Micrarchaeota archaeon]|nr:Kae1-associated serine/threonine protein kinase [Candidatus Micrarchaeota archaeon]
MRGAEAILTRKRLLGRECVVKARMVKGYREKELDCRLRGERTRGEARLLHKAKLAGVPCPAVLELDEFSITMEFLEGERPEMGLGESCEAGRMLAKLHAADIIHGDYTPANLIASRAGTGSGKAMHVIDFGLGYISNDVEDKAVDVFTMLRALEKKEKKDAFIEGYRAYEKEKAVLARVRDVEKRVRYAV